MVFFCEGDGITDPRLESEALELVGKCGGREILSRDRYVDVSRQPLNTTRDDGNAADDGTGTTEFIKEDGEGGGELKFGTEVVTSAAANSLVGPRHRRPGRANGVGRFGRQSPTRPTSNRVGNATMGGNAADVSVARESQR